MKTHLMILAASVFVLSAMAQETNECAPRKEKKNHPDRQEQVEKKREKYQQRRLQFMERELKKIGVTEEEKAQIAELQKSHKRKMEANAQSTEMARTKLSDLLAEGAPMEELEAAIQEISTAQTEQLRILVGNRIEMERILGKDKHDKFMKNARTQYKKHGRRGGPPLPPRPGVPPIPGQERPHKEPPPLPETPPSSEN